MFKFHGYLGGGEGRLFYPDLFVRNKPAHHVKVDQEREELFTPERFC